MKRAFIISGIVLLIILAVIFSLFFFARRSSVKEGREPLSFKTFIGLGDRTPTDQTGTGSFSSDFIADQNFGTTPSNDTGAGNTGGSTNVSGASNETLNSGGNRSRASVFTDSGISPGNGIGGNGALSGQSGIGGSTPLPPTVISPGFPSAPGTAVPTPEPISPPITSPIEGPRTEIGTVTEDTGPIAALAACSDEDLNITFTPEELARLSALQARFYQISLELRTEADVSAELANHDEFALTEARLTELTNFCESKVSSINTSLTRRVATPFWRNAGSDVESYTTESSPQVSVSNPSGWKAQLERLLRINLW